MYLGTILKKHLAASKFSLFLPARSLPVLRPWSAVPVWRVQALSQTAPYLLVFVVAAAPALYLGINHQGFFQSPDEMARFIAAETFAQQGHFYIEDDVTRLQTGTVAAPRGFTEHGDRAVPIYSLGTLAFLGVTQLLWGSWALVALAAVPGLLFAFLFGLVRKVRPDASVYVGLALLGVAPLWYWVNRVYMDLGLTMLFVTIGAYCFAVALERRAAPWLFISSVCLGMAATMRVPEAPFLLLVGLAFVLGFVHRMGGSRRIMVGALGLYVSGQVIGFVLPTALLNWSTYGSPMTFGYTIFHENHFPNRAATPDGLILSVLGTLRNAIFPTPMDLTVLRNALVYQVIFAIPFAAILGMAGLVLYARRAFNSLGLPAAILLFVALLYMVVSRADPGTFLAFATEPDLRQSIIRYWMPFYLVLAIGVALCLSRLPKPVSVLAMVMVLVLSAPLVWTRGPESVLPMTQSLGAQSTAWAATLEATTEPGAVVIAGGTYDKHTAPIRRTVGIWRPSETEASMVNLTDLETIARTADLAARVTRELERPVYFVLSRHEPDNAVDTIGSRLDSEFLSIQAIEGSAVGEIWRVVDRNHQ